MKIQNYNLHNNPAYCSAIFKGLYFEKVNKDSVNIAACCNNEPVNVTGIDFANDVELNRRRELITQGVKIPECNKCWEVEDAGLISIRYNMNDMETVYNLEPYKVELATVDYNVDPVCNAKCIMCGRYFSSLWAAEDWEFDKVISDRPYKNTRKNEMISQFDFSNLKRIYFNGGEPFLTDEHVNVLESIPDISRTFIAYNTNGSILPSDRVRALWDKAGAVSINASVDGIESTFEYTRNPLKWDEVKSNVEQMTAWGYKVNLSYTMGIHNLLDVKDTKNWYLKFGKGDFNVHLCSLYFHIRNAPKRLKEIFLDYLKDEEGYWVPGVRNTLESNLDYENYEWVEELDRLDARRKNNWRQDLTGLSKTYIVKEF